MAYTDDEMLMLSGIQHFAFCKRQWCLIYVDSLWQDNSLTIEGQWLHRHVDNPFMKERDGNVIKLHSVSMASKELGLYGVADIVELLLTDMEEEGIGLTGYPGFWRPFPVEYKRGKPKVDEIDEVQLCAQAICLEEMYEVSVTEGAIYYGETRHRFPVRFTRSLRDKAYEYSHEMHSIVSSGKMPGAEKKPRCRSCSMKDICFPESLWVSKSPSKYLSILQE